MSTSFVFSKDTCKPSTSQNEQRRYIPDFGCVWFVVAVCLAPFTLILRLNKLILAKTLKKTDYFTIWSKSDVWLITFLLLSDN